MRAHRLLAAAHDVDAVQQHAARHRGARRKKPHQGERSRRLAAARLADQSEPLTALEPERHALHRVQRPTARQVEPDVEILGLEQRAHSASAFRPTSGRSRKPRADTCATFRRGFSASSSAWPIRLQHRISSRDDDPWRNDRPPRSSRDRRALKRVLDHLAERDAARVAEPEKRERGLVEHRHRDRQHRVGDQ